jgi:GntR family transcriptional regulator
MKDSDSIMDNYSPKYVQIYDKLRSDIVLRKYLPGSFLPAERHLITMFDAGRGTVRKALSQLQNDGFISIRQGSGAVVLNPEDSRGKFDPSRWHATGIMMEFFGDSGNINTSPIALDTVEAGKEAASVLGLEPGTRVYRLQQIRMMGEIPYLYRIEHFREDLCPAMEAHIREIETSFFFYEKVYNLHVTSSEEHISARSAGFVESRILGVEVGAALLCTKRKNVCEKGPFLYAEFIANPEYYGYKINASYG